MDGVLALTLRPTAYEYRDDNNAPMSGLQPPPSAFRAVEQEATAAVLTTYMILPIISGLGYHSR